MNQPQEWLTQPGGLADRLAALRNRTGLTGKDFAERLGWPASKVSRIENGRTMPSAADLDEWARAAGADAETAHELMEVLEEAQAARRDWRRRMGRGQAAVQRDYLELTQQSTLIRYFDLVYVPGFLQTRDYAHRVLTEMVALHNLPIDDVDGAIAERLQRQQLLYDVGKQFEFIMGESALRYRLTPDPAAMRAQLDRLQTVIDLPNVRFGIIPFGPHLPTTPQNKFELYDDVAVVETFLGEEFYFDDRASFYAKVMDLLWGEAVTGSEARRLIVAAADALPGT